MKQNNPSYLFGMYEPDTDSVIVNAINDTYTNSPLTISCEKCKYSSDYTAFNVLGMEVQISDDQLSKALKCLPERKRNIILLSYFMDMSDAEIGELMNVVRSTVYRHRTSTLEEIRKMMEEE